jgi:hypothetical protein
VSLAFSWTSVLRHIIKVLMDYLVRASVSNCPNLPKQSTFLILSHFWKTFYIKLSKYFSILIIYCFLLVLKTTNLSIWTSNFPTSNNLTTISNPQNRKLQIFNSQPLQTSTQYHQNLKITPSNTTPSAINRELKFSLELAKTGQILKP